MIKAVLCDLGDTLINFHRINVFKAFMLGAKETYNYLGNDLGIRLPSFTRYRRYQEWSIRWAYLKSKITGREFNSLNTLRVCNQRLGIEVPADRMDELAWRWYKPLAAEAKADTSSAPMLEELVRRDLKRAIVSNTFVPPSALDRHLEQEKLLDYFPWRIYSCDVGVRKPNPIIFQAALKAVAVRPEEAVFIGDSPRADIRGSRRVGMFAVFKPQTAKQIQPDTRTFVVDNLREVPGIIDRINRDFFKANSS